MPNGSAVSPLAVIGTSHHVAEVEFRERVHLTSADATRLGADLAERCSEVVVLSTCNRTEVYVWSEAVADAKRSIVAALAERSGLPAAEIDLRLYVRQGDDAAVHLFRVAAGLDSLLQGEAQVLGQVRDAHAGAQAAGTTGSILNHLFARGIRLAKRLHTETAIGSLGRSVPAAAAEVAARALGGLDGRRVLVIGAGKIGTLAIANLVRRGAENVFVANHRPARAERLAARFGGAAIAWDALPRELEQTDAVISSTSCPRTILSAAEVEPSVRRRDGRSLVLVDIAVPRDLDPEIGRLPGCTLYDIDDLADAMGERVAEQRAELAAAERAIADEAAAFRGWVRSRDAVPAIVALRRRAEAIRADELAGASRLRHLSDEDRAAVDVVTARIVNKLLHAPMLGIKEAAGAPEADAHLDTVYRLFDLDEQRG